MGGSRFWKWDAAETQSSLSFQGTSQQKKTTPFSAISHDTAPRSQDLSEKMSQQAANAELSTVQIAKPLFRAKAVDPPASTGPSAVVLVVVASDAPRCNHPFFHISTVWTPQLRISNNLGATSSMCDDNGNCKLGISVEVHCAASARELMANGFPILDAPVCFTTQTLLHAVCVLFHVRQLNVPPCGNKLPSQA